MIIMLLLQARNLARLFPNIVKDKKDKFYYLENDVLKILTFTKGSYEVKDINAIIQQKVPNESIKLVVDQGSARCKIFFKTRI